jgi:hypothetical protein
MDLFPRVAILVPYLKYRRILFRYPRNTLYPRTSRGGTLLRRYASVVRAYSLYRRLLVKAYAR